MSELYIEDIKAVANGMAEDEMKIFLTQVDRKLLEGELSRRADEAEATLADIAQKLMSNVPV